MKLLMTCIYILAILVTTTLHYSFAYPSTTPAELETTSSTSANANSKITTIPSTTIRTSFKQSSANSAQKWNDNPSTTETVILPPTGRNLQFPSFHEDVFELAPFPSSYDIFADHQRRPVLDFGSPFPSFESHPMDFDETVEVRPTHPFSPIIVPQPMNNFKDNYPLDVGAGVMAPAGRQIVFRPLFAYRRQNAQRRRIYSKPPSTLSSSSPSSSYNYAQRRQQEYPYRYSSYSYPSRYPNYYSTAQYDYVS